MKVDENPANILTVMLRSSSGRRRRPDHHDRTFARIFIHHFKLVPENCVSNSECMKPLLMTGEERRVEGSRGEWRGVEESRGMWRRVEGGRGLRVEGSSGSRVQDKLNGHL